MALGNHCPMGQALLKASLEGTLLCLPFGIPGAQPRAGESAISLRGSPGREHVGQNPESASLDRPVLSGSTFRLRTFSG